MPEHMLHVDAAILGVAWLAAWAGMAWLALAMPAHWEQVRGHDALPRGSAIALRLFGAAGLVVAMALCLHVDHGSMASLVWIMSLATAACTVAMLLSWQPRALRFLVAWA